ncbi:MAG TPA: hypothetical protein VG389_08855 [Myxococcota bacterium]|jgi:hypothetical protein|nr:hypothetical protein [Myxococcota bacterium]
MPRDALVREDERQVPLAEGSSLVNSLPFDRIVVRSAGAEHAYTVSQFLLMRLHERVRLLLAHDLEFYAGHRPIDRTAALKALREWSAQPA